MFSHELNAEVCVRFFVFFFFNLKKLICSCIESQLSLFFSFLPFLVSTVLQIQFFKFTILALLLVLYYKAMTLFYEVLLACLH
jgi:hypothetical protein